MFSPCIIIVNHFYYPTNALNYTIICIIECISQIIKVIDFIGLVGHLIITLVVV